MILQAVAVQSTLPRPSFSYKRIDIFFSVHLTGIVATDYHIYLFLSLFISKYFTCFHMFKEARCIFLSSLRGGYLLLSLNTLMIFDYFE